MSDQKSVRVPAAVTDQVNEVLHLLAVHGVRALSPQQQQLVTAHLQEHRGYNSGLVYTLALQSLLESMRERCNATS